MQAPPARPILACPLCQGKAFREGEGGLDSKWGTSQHRVRIAICEQCSFVMQFSKGRSLWGMPQLKG